METIQFWLFAIGVYIIYRIIYNFFVSNLQEKLYKEQDMFADYTPHFIVGSFALVVACFMSIAIYEMMF
jgi:hypothetical protein